MPPRPRRLTKVAAAAEPAPPKVRASRAKNKPTALDIASASNPTELEDIPPLLPPRASPLSPVAAPQSPRYSFRPKNDPHPALSAGLQPSTRDEMSRGAAEKRAAKEAVAAAQRAEEEEEAAELQRKIAEVAELELALKAKKAAREADFAARDFLPSTSMDIDASSDPGVQPSSESDSDYPSTPIKATMSTAAKSKSTAAQGKEQKRAKKRGLHDAIEEYKAKVGDSKRKAPAKSTAGRSTSTKRPRPSEDPFIDNWQQLTTVIAPTSRTTSSHTVPKRARKPTKLEQRRADEAIGGLSDEDLRTRPQDIPQPRFGQVAQQAAIVGDSTTLQVPSSGSRAPRGFDTLPQFVKLLWKPRVLPAMKSRVGSYSDPWDLDGDSNRFQTDAQQIMNSLWRNQQYQVTKSSAVYKVLRQAIYDWRRSLHNATVDVVSTDIDTNCNGPDEVKQYVRRALADGGFAFWGEPGLTPETRSGALESEYILKSLSFHMNEIKNSTVRAEWCRGALVVVSVSVERILLAHWTGKFTSLDDFKEENCRIQTDRWMKSVAAKEGKPHRIQAIMDGARAYLESEPTADVPAGDVMHGLRESCVDLSSPVRGD